jgi:hypothetical protein
MVDFSDKDTHDRHDLSSERTPQKRRDSNFEKEKKIWSNVQDLGSTPKHTD